MEPDLRVGWVGIGRMGNPMSRLALRAGFRLVVLEPLAENRATIVAEGANVAHTCEELVEAADVVVTTIPNDAVLRAIVLGEQGLARHLRSGQTLVEMSTVSPAVSVEVAAALAARGVAYLRAPVSGGTAAAAAGKLAVLASGPEPTFAAQTPLLATFSARRFHLGPGEEARYAKLVLNALAGATSALLGEALMLGKKGNLSVEAMLEVILESAVASPLIACKRDLLVARNVDPVFSVNQMIEDIDLVLDAARTDHVPMYLTALIRQQYEAAYSEGLADKDFFVMIEQYERLAGLKVDVLGEAGVEHSFAAL